MAKATKEIEMQVSVEKLSSAILDFESYPEFLKEVVAVERLAGGSPARFRVRFELEIIKRFAYVLEFDVKPNEEIAWRLVESDFFKKNEGRWLLETQDRDRTKVRYEVDIGVGFLIPGFVSRKLAEQNLPSMLAHFEQRARLKKG